MAVVGGNKLWEKQYSWCNQVLRISSRVLFSFAKNNKHISDAKACNQDDFS